MVNEYEEWATRLSQRKTLMHYPQVLEEAGSLFVEFAKVEEQSVVRPLRMIVDLGLQGEVLGIEIINLASKAGNNCLRTISQSVSTVGDVLRYSYDKDSDSFYLRLKVGRSVDQKAVQGSMFLDREGEIIALSTDSLFLVGG